MLRLGVVCMHVVPLGGLQLSSRERASSAGALNKSLGSALTRKEGRKQQSANSTCVPAACDSASLDNNNNNNNINNIVNYLNSWSVKLCACHCVGPSVDHFDQILLVLSIGRFHSHHHGNSCNHQWMQWYIWVSGKLVISLPEIRHVRRKISTVKRNNAIFPWLFTIIKSP